MGVFDNPSSFYYLDLLTFPEKEDSATSSGRHNITKTKQSHTKKINTSKLFTVCFMKYNENRITEIS
jgi:hypothetical protein